MQGWVVVHHLVPNFMRELSVSSKTMLLSARHFGLSPTTVHNMVKIFREPGEINLYELQQRGFVGTEYVCLTGLPAVQICLLLKMYGSS